MAYRLQTLLDLRRGAEDEAARTLASAGEAHRLAKAEQTRLDTFAADARRLAVAEREATRSEPAARAADAVAASRYLARLDADARRLERHAATHREGALAQAVASEQVARDRHLVARRDREVLDKHRAREAAVDRRDALRRKEAAADDLPPRRNH